MGLDHRRRLWVECMVFARLALVCSERGSVALWRTDLFGLEGVTSQESAGLRKAVSWRVFLLGWFYQVSMYLD